MDDGGPLRLRCADLADYLTSVILVDFFVYLLPQQL